MMKGVWMGVSGLRTGVFLFACAVLSVRAQALSDLERARSEALAPRSDRVAPVAVFRTEGTVVHPEALLRSGTGVCTLRYPKEGKPPVIALDLGEASAGGFAVFNVTAKRGSGEGTNGMPVLRLAYANHPDGLTPTGCFTRKTSARYLGPAVDLPILPANLNRHECYTIPRAGKYIAPLIQGQARYVLVRLDTPDTEVSLDSLELVNSGVHDRSPLDGYFRCSDERINRLWQISVWTTQIAAFPHNNAWRTIDGWLLPRKLEQADGVGLSKRCGAWGDGTAECVFELRANPDAASGVGLICHAADATNGVIVTVRQPAECRVIRRVGGEDTLLHTAPLPEPLIDGVPHTLAVTFTGKRLTVRLDGRVVADALDIPDDAPGTVGFYTEKEWWPLVDSIRVRDGSGKALLEETFDGALDDWDFPRTLAYVSDGAKRDRLVWSGDLYWAERNRFYAFSDPLYMRDSIKMLAFNQTPDGYVHASPYPERSVPPQKGDYGPFPSDEFAAWLVPVAWDYYLYTADIETMRLICPAVTRLMRYLKAYRRPDGLFSQRTETSKHACNLNLGDTTTRSYMNILLWACWRDAAKLSDVLGQTRNAARYRMEADTLRQAIEKALWDEKNGCYILSLEKPVFAFEANALALAFRFVSDERAARIAPKLTYNGHGKFQALAARGQFEYGRTAEALRTLAAHGWYRLLAPDWKGAKTTTECMALHRSGWGDESHPDTAIAGLFSAYLLGITPLKPGYSQFRFAPQPQRDLTFAEGLVPTPHGAIKASWRLTGTILTFRLKVPNGTRADVISPPCKLFLVNGVPGTGKALAPGDYTFEAQGVSESVLAPLADQSATPSVSVGNHKWRASSSHDVNGLGLAGIAADPADTKVLGYSSARCTKPDASEWVEVDLGEVREVRSVAFYPRTNMASVEGGLTCFPKRFVIEGATDPGVFKELKMCDTAKAELPGPWVEDLYTVIGYPKVRYLRFSNRLMGDRAKDEPGYYRFQFRRIQIR